MPPRKPRKESAQLPATSRSTKSMAGSSQSTSQANSPTMNPSNITKRGPTTKHRNTNKTAKKTTPVPASTKPHINPKVFQAEDMDRLQEEQREKQFRDKLCSLCTNIDHSVYHHHWSTADLRTFAICYSETGTFMCPICHTMEQTLQPVHLTKRVILCSSTLYGIWDQQSLPTITDHFEMECIVGARVRDLTRALKRNYLYLSSRLEIIVVAGINNVGEGQDSAEIVKEIQELKTCVLEHSEEHSHNPPSYVSVSTLFFPPKFCSLTVPTDAPDLKEWVPRPNFVNRLETIEEVNKAIKEMNQKDGLNWVNLHLHGIKVFKSGTKQHKFDTRPGATQIWREKEVTRKLHFTMDNKLKIINYINKCFQSNSSDKAVTENKSS